MGVEEWGAWGERCGPGAAVRRAGCESTRAVLLLCTCLLLCTRTDVHTSARARSYSYVPATAFRQARLRYVSTGAASLLAVALVLFLAGGPSGSSSLAVAKSEQLDAVPRTSSLEEVRPISTLHA